MSIKMSIKAQQFLKTLNEIEAKMYASNVFFESMELVHKRNELTELLSVIRGELYKNNIDDEKIDAWMEQKKELDIEFDRIQKQVWIRGEK